MTPEEAEAKAKRAELEGKYAAIEAEIVVEQNSSSYHIDHQTRLKQAANTLAAFDIEARARFGALRWAEITSP